MFPQKVVIALKRGETPRITAKDKPIKCSKCGIEPEIIRDKDGFITATCPKCDGTVLYVV